LSEGFGGALDLTGANTEGMKPIDSGTYAFELFDYKWEETKGSEGSKLPAGTPRLNVQLKCIDEPFENRRVFDGFNFPPADYDAEKKAQAEGFFVRFLMAMGLPEETVKAKKFNANEALEALVGEPVLATVGIKKYEQGAREGEEYNVVKGYKPLSSRGDDASGGLL
jgi:hypothetical protein